MSSPDAEDLSPSPEHSGDEDDTDMLDEKGLHGEGDSSPPHSGSGRKSSSNAKDASRPRRKKARRACLACQRAHLTCGDERPCKRCIKRGLQDACQDGVRKKAKYLHDAPPEALMPGVGGHYREANGSQQSLQGQDSVPNSAVSMVQQTGFYPQGQTGSFGLYQQNPSDSQMSVQMQDASPISSFSNQQTPISPPYAQSGGNQTTTPGSASLPSASQAAAPQMQGFRGPLFDPSDPALYNFDIASLNFGSHYGALEFGMLGHISGAAADTPPNDGGLLTPLAQPPNMFQQTGGVSPQLPDSSTLIPTTMPFVADSMSDWPNPPVRQNSLQQMQTQKTMDNSLRHDGFSGPYAFTIGAGPSSLSSASPASTGQDMSAGYDQNSVSQQFFVNPNQQQTQQNSLFAQPQQAQAASGFALQPVNPNVGPRKRRRDTRAIYEELKQPYPYTQAFHRLQKLLQQRLPSNKVVRVAKAMASIRPTFIACMKDLDEQDLIHQEQTFQRKLWSYQDWLEYMGTPTLIIRRSGEVAAVGKEFCILSGWRKDVLLGKDPNLNVNWDCSPGQNSGASSRNASSTPRIPTQEDNSRPQPVFLAELLDSDSVVQFYEDFARLAFGDARGAVERRCRVMKYQAKLDDDTATNTTDSIGQRDEGSRKKQKPRNLTRLDNPDGAGASAEKNQSWRPEKDSVECMMGWMCWHDQFDMPAMIVMNFLPILQPTQPDSERSRMSTASLPPR